MEELFKIPRLSFAKCKEVVDIPPLIAIQEDSYGWFLQKDVEPDQRRMQGLQQVFLETFPIADFNNRVVLEFLGYTLGEIKHTEEECRDRDVTYGIPLKVKLRLRNCQTGVMTDQDVFMRDMPLMTKRGTFVINGAERVIVSQLHRSPGILFSYDSQEKIYSCRLIPYRGAWVEFELDINNVINVRLGRKRKMSATILLRAMGYSSTDEIIKLFHPDMKALPVDEKLLEMRLAESVKFGSMVIPIGTRITRALIEQFQEAGMLEIKALSADAAIILNTLEKDISVSTDDALLKLYAVLRPGEPPTHENARQAFERLLFDPERYDLSEVGRYKINQKLNLNTPLSQWILTHEDILESLKYLIKIVMKEGEIDDIDHLGNRRVRPVGELLQDQIRIGFARLEKSIKERMTIQDVAGMTPQSVVNIKPVTASINEFFGSNQLSQFMDQTNPLAELTHKRRLSALGQGGLSKERAGFEVRDVHYSHFGRICPIETPEGPNIGLIVSMSVYGKINKYGFIETPYRKVVDSVVTNEMEYISADKETKCIIVQADIPVDENGKLLGEVVPSRCKDDFPLVLPSQVNYAGTSLKQIISVSTSMIPFLEHDDANRALMGSNMQRQAVPLLYPQSPLVGTGMEHYVARDSGIVAFADVSGIIRRATADLIILAGDDGQEYTYKLIKFKRSNQATCLHQRAIVKKGDRVKKSQPLSEGTGIQGGELALGKDVLVAFMPWNGYNFEDAVIISERLVRDDVFTSIHIEKFEIEARDTQLGAEVITRDIPNLGDEAMRDLDKNGIIRIGAFVKSGDILVGKITPKGETELTPEYKLLHSIFGEKIREVRDTSLRMPYGNEGIVIDVKYFSSKAGDDLPAGVEELVKVYVANKRKITVGDKIAGRHGNKGVIARIVPEADLPYMEDGTPVDMILNSLSVPSRMNIGQVLETHLGWAAKHLGVKYACPVFDGATEAEIEQKLLEAGLPADGKMTLYDGKTGEKFEQKVTVGYIYILKLAHLVEDKIHARSIGPYSLVTQQPLGGKAQFGGQRLGEMEVWALEAYGASHILQEFLTIKSDDIIGRAKVYEAIVKGENAANPGVPESFNVLVHELQGLGLDIKILDDNNREIEITSMIEERRSQNTSKMPWEREMRDTVEMR